MTFGHVIHSMTARHRAAEFLRFLKLIRASVPEDLELATLGWVHWFNTERLHGTLGDIPPAEFEDRHYAQLQLAG